MEKATQYVPPIQEEVVKFGKPSSDEYKPIEGGYDEAPTPFDYSKATGYSYKPVTFKDMQNGVKLDLMANAGAYSTVKAIGTATAMTGNPVGATIGALAYLGSEGYAFTKNAILSTDENAFWEDYFEKVNEVQAEKGTIGDMLAGFTQGSSFFTGSNTPEEVKDVTDSGAFMAGDIVGMLARDFTMMAIGSSVLKSVGGKVVSARKNLAKAEAVVASKGQTAETLQAVANAKEAIATAMSAEAVAGSNAGFIAGASISNALNTAMDSYANDGGVINAMRNGFAHGASTGITGHFFLNHFDKVMKKVMPKLLDTTIGASLKTGTEFSAWGLGEEVVNATLIEGMGGESDLQLDPIAYAAMFGLGAAGSAIFRGKKGKKIVESVLDDVKPIVVGEEIAKKKAINKAEEITESIANKFLRDLYGDKAPAMKLMGIDDFKRKPNDIADSFVGLMNRYSLKSPQEIRTLGNIVLLEGKRTSKSFEEILKEKMMNDTRYLDLSKEDIKHIVKMVYERFQ